ncbi:MAG: hypothetical protein HOL51_25760 [Gemmatimonadetes bacterium]|jgi:hypothetical protein|nr:hypothetical protein [Gemmatimonadota bacterium]MDE0965739.1 hypothetical protein [Candidatus Latescibacterota bacterium]MBT5329530.1 hypothetical protein [Gemmatimonadota bacterium]MBT5451998.1 hypothetical protein [Gemmatimonadota bacterium]MBT5800133.1 hypothetical protein [Gemmatimonadota bacterium]|tara:strand:- start:808 stop:1059 length:252 start_codon:yes stop_codon:yes gene_type:complete
MPVWSVAPIGLRQRQRTSLPPDGLAAPAPAATDENADSRAPGKPGAPSPKTEILTTDTGYSRGYDSDIDSTSGYTQSTEVWFP